MNSQYTTREVSKLLNLPEHSIRRLAQAGFLGSEETARHPKALGSRYAFDFRDLLVLKTAAKLVADGVASARVQRVLEQLRNQLPPDYPLSGMQLSLRGEKIVVKSHGQTWEPETGQCMLGFSSTPPNPASVPTLTQTRSDAQTAPSVESLMEELGEADDYDSANAWFEVGVALEDTEPHKAYEAYLRTLACNPEHAEAYINVGTLCSLAGEPKRALAFFQMAIRLEPNQPVAHFNAAITHQDLTNCEKAILSYREAVRCDPDFADAHYNLAILLEEHGKVEEANLHKRRYEDIIHAPKP